MPTTASNGIAMRPVPKMSCERKIWLAVVWLFTWLIPSPCLRIFGMRRSDIQIAWREKVTIFIIILLSCSGLIFFIIGLGQIICPKVKVLSIYEVESYNTEKQPYVSIYGRYYDISDIVKSHVYGSIGVQKFQMQAIYGTDVSQMFYPSHQWSKVCPGIVDPGAAWDNLMERNPSQTMWPHQASASDGTESDYLGFLEQYARGRIGWRKEYVADTSSSTVKRLIMFDNVYDVSTYYNANPGFFDENMNWIFTNMVGKDATPQMNVLLGQDAAKYRAVLNCMNHLFYIGTVDHRNDMVCQLSNWILVAASGVIVLIIAVKFLAALLQLFQGGKPQEQDRYVIIQVPCYTEGKDSLQKTFNSIAKDEYESRLKMMMVIIDGIVTGDGNAKSTADLALEILYGGKDRIPQNTEVFDYQAIGEGSKQHNRARVYSGIYDVKGGHHLPFIVVLKCGTDAELVKPGNRGKRDSQLILMNFLSKIYSDGDFCPLEYAIYRHLTEIFNIDPTHYEFVLMVDADTQIAPNAINVYVANMVVNSDVIGTCGETNVADEDGGTWITSIQVYEYFISHHLAKAFESFFGTVTCLPGCFCMYRIRDREMNPLFVMPRLVHDYAENNVDTLHKKNLLTLGEDRYLTTLMLKYFPRLRTTFIPRAKCTSIAPDQWNVLLSQRRRWINSTVHNLVEIVMHMSGMCGVCCFSMRFIVLIDLLSTIVLPASVVYVCWLIYTLISQTGTFPIVSMAILGGIYGLQVIIFVLKKEFAMIGWMLIYCTVGMPIFNFLIPLYSFWKMNDVSWGQTRMVEGDNGKMLEAGADSVFDPSVIAKIPVSTWKKNTIKPPAPLPNMASVHGIPVPIAQHPAMQKGGMSANGGSVMGTAPSWVPSNYVPSIQPPSSEDTISSHSTPTSPPLAHMQPQYMQSMQSIQPQYMQQQSPYGAVYQYPMPVQQMYPHMYPVPRAPISDIGNPSPYPMSQSGSVAGSIRSDSPRPYGQRGASRHRDEEERRGRRSRSRQHHHRKQRRGTSHDTEDSGTESDYDVASRSQRRRRYPNPPPPVSVAPSVAISLAAPSLALPDMHDDETFGDLSLEFMGKK